MSVQDGNVDIFGYLQKAKFVAFPAFSNRLFTNFQDNIGMSFSLGIWAFLVLYSSFSILFENLLIFDVAGEQ